MCRLLTIGWFVFSCHVALFGQTENKSDIVTGKAQVPEIFTSGFIDIINNGQVNAGARFIRLNIGEPGKFVLPLSIYGGISNNALSGQPNNQLSSRGNEHLINQYINPMSGLINLSLEGIHYLRESSRLTKVGLLYQVGERILTGYRTGAVGNAGTGRPSNFLNSYAATGLYFQTGAWERGKNGQLGCCWLAARYIICKSSRGSIRTFLPDTDTDGWYHGYSVGFGIEISSLVNIKAVYYEYLKKPEIEYSLPIYQFSFNYTLKK